MKRWVVMILILSMTLALFCGCKIENPDDFTAETDKEIGFETPEDEPGDQPEDESADQPEEEPSDRPADEPEAGPIDEPVEEPSDQPADELSKEPAGDEPAAVTKETSGTPITFLVQNLKVGGNQVGTIDERGGFSNNLYRRARRFREEVKDVDADVVLTCEGTPGWITFFESDPYLSENYDFVYQWRAPDGFAAFPEGTPLLYKSAKYTLVESGHFWHSKTPNRQSICYDTDNYRICTWVKLKDNATGAEFYAYTCHIDNNSYEGGTAGVSTMEQYQTMLSKLPEDAFAFVGGDYNITYRDPIYEMTMDWEKMFDLQDMALNMKDDGLAEVGNTGCSLCSTWETGAARDYHDEDTKFTARHIDHLMAKPNPHLAVDYWNINWKGYESPEEQVKFGYISDHYGLVVKVRIGTKADYSQYQAEH